MFKEANKGKRKACEDESEHEYGTAVRSIQLQTLYLLPLNRTVLFSAILISLLLAETCDSPTYFRGTRRAK